MLTAEQLAMRADAIGASESPAIVGASPFADAITIWNYKMGFDKFQETDQTRIGNYCEDGIAQMYADETGRELANFGTLRHPKYPFMIATPDRCVFGERRIVQIKIVGAWMAHHWDNGVPEYVEIQVQHEMEVADVDVCDVAVVIGGTDYRCVPVERDREMGAQIVTVCEHFYTHHMKPRVMPEATGSESSGIALRAAYKQQTSAMRPAPIEADFEASRYLGAKAAIAEYTAKLALAEQRLKQFIGEDEGIAGESFIATWKKNAAGHRVFSCKERGKRRSRLTEAA